MAKRKTSGPKLTFWESLFIHQMFRVGGYETVDVYDKDIPAPFYPKQWSGQKRVPVVECLREHRGPKDSCRLCQKNRTAHKFKDQFSDRGRLVLILFLIILLFMIGGGVSILNLLNK